MLCQWRRKEVRKPGLSKSMKGDVLQTPINNVFVLKTGLWRPVVEWLGRSAHDQRIPGLSPGRTRSRLSPRVDQCSSTGLSKAEWCVSCP
jgi:hypothetical protein